MEWCLEFLKDCFMNEREHESLMIFCEKSFEVREFH